ncbi:L-glutamate gamma-semialdehyde dehydrogenase [Henriciella pelagia]|uniref:L-glutamate gamma-semialdehyde dehydrogenase n=1 Tax=Henriciella pelagia TaxID=1977912 RepID=A0ABQ1JZ43_9PROT|nr:L-glutamate gamma-semialdehyde dehydrogenase [Henriciella pelagia]GGB80015.1 1-pyrroline-5-carboxylate dehydrogenase [Henriciella pelagia]
MISPENCKVREFAPGSPERKSVEAEIEHQRLNPRDIDPVINGKRIQMDHRTRIFEPHAHARTLGTFGSAGAREAQLAVDAANAARREWGNLPASARRAVFIRAANLLEGPFNDRLMAATMLGQSKTFYQAEIDASAELVDFLRLNVAFSERLEEWQPSSEGSERNRLELRPLDGFVFAASPFNFTAIAGNLCLAPALMGNTVVWKPSERSMLSAAFIMDLFEAAGLPPGVINMLPTSDPAAVGDVVLADRHLAGVHFTGSTGTFDHIWRTVGKNISAYAAYPRLVGETGGKDFIFAHASADVDALVTALIRGAFDYQGQKCSAASRAYIPRSLFKEVCERLHAEVSKIRYGDVTDGTNFMGAVIDERSFDQCSNFLAYADKTSGHKLIAGAAPDRGEGYFVPPTVIACESATSKLMTDEIFGPILALYAYEDADIEQALEIVDSSTPYALTGAIFASDPAVIDRLSKRLRFAAGNFYINDKPTGAVVGRQPFGGSRRSGTNDKAGSPYNLMRWASPRTVKEQFLPPVSHLYRHMEG